jgi:hypothetical protein
MLKLRRRAVFCGIIGLAGCDATPPETARLPNFGDFVSIDPVRYSLEQSAYLLTERQYLTGRPWEAAKVIAGLEFVTVELRYGPRWTEFSPLASLGFARARAEWRSALGIAADAPPQAVIDAMTLLRNAYAAQSLTAAAAALRPPLFTPGGQETLARLADLPGLPETTQAAVFARQALFSDQGNRYSAR